MTRNPQELITIARARMQGGFTTKGAKADAAFLVRNAYDAVRQSLFHRMLDIRNAAGIQPGQEGEAWRKKIDAAPYSVAHWNAKRAAFYTEAAEAADVVLANECAALRAEIMATPVIKPAVRPRTPAQMAKDAKARTCQICGRPIFAEVGIIAHHGYQRPGQGWQTASCHGARELPFEADKAVLIQWIGIVEKQLEAEQAARAEVAAERKPVHVSYSVARIGENHRQVRDGMGNLVYDERSFDITRATAAQVKAEHDGYFSFSGNHFYGVAEGAEFDALLVRDLRARDGQIKLTSEHLEWQRGRERAWVALEHWNGKAWQLITAEG